MNRRVWYVVGILILLVVVILGVVISVHKHQAVLPTQRNIPTASSTPPEVQSSNPSILSIYSSGEYGFSFIYPGNAKVVDSYSSTTNDSLPWRLEDTSTGTSIVQMIIGDQELRIGASMNKEASAACTKASQAEKDGGTQMIGTTSWHVFTFQKLGTDSQKEVTSYRTVHKGKCYVLELLLPIGSVASSTGYTLQDSIKSFTFAT